jgi:hypothetical protein
MNVMRARFIKELVVAESNWLFVFYAGTQEELDMIRYGSDYPLHAAVMEDDIELFQELLVQAIDEQSNALGDNGNKSFDLQTIDNEGRTCLQIAINFGFISFLISLLEFSAKYEHVMKAILRSLDSCADDALKISVFVENKFSHATLVAHSHLLWFHLIEIITYETTDVIIKEYVMKYPDLASSIDFKGRAAFDVAAPLNKLAIQSLFLWHGRYHMKQIPEHQSATCYVYFGTDEGNIDESGNGRRVALKLMKFKSFFIREVQIRQHNFDEKYVINIAQTHPAYEPGRDDKYLMDDDKWPEQIHVEVLHDKEGNQLPLTKANAEKLYCVVMPLADRNMYVALKQERFAGEICT